MSRTASKRSRDGRRSRGGSTDAFLTSNWTCIWGRGCKGILDVPAEDLNQGCCSIGAELADPEEAMTVSALAATLGPGDRSSTTRRSMPTTCSATPRRTNTKVVDGACIFLNRPGFAGGEGCALHLAALRRRRVADRVEAVGVLAVADQGRLGGSDDGTEIATVRGWARRDWGDDGDDDALVLHGRARGLHRRPPGVRLARRRARRPWSATTSTSNCAAASRDRALPRLGQHSSRRTCALWAGSATAAGRSAASGDRLTSRDR